MKHPSISVLTAAGYVVINTAHVYLLEHYSRKNNQHQVTTTPTKDSSVLVLIPSYRENPESLARCLRSLTCQDYPHIEVVLVDSSNDPELVKVYEQYKKDGWTAEWSSEQLDKRAAQDVGFRKFAKECDYVLTVDSDTELCDPDTLRILVGMMDSDDQIGAITGQLKSPTTNRWSRAAAQHLHYLNQEMAAESWFHAVSCSRGPMSLFRRQVLDFIWNEYQMNQTPGDDVDLAQQVLAQGYKTMFYPQAVAQTDMPVHWHQSRNQVARWELTNRRYSRKIWKNLSRQPQKRFLRFNLLNNQASPLLLGVPAASLLRNLATGSLEGIGRDLVVLAVMLGTRPLLFWCQDGKDGLRFGGYEMITILPAKYRAWFSRDLSWRTRK